MADKISGAADKVSDFIRRMSGVTGVNSLWLEKAARSGMLNLDTATADDVYRLASQMAGRKAPARQLELPLGPGASEPDIRALIPRQSDGALAPIDNGFRGYTLPDAPERPMGLATVNRELAPLPRGLSQIDPGYRRGVTVDAVDVADPTHVPMGGRGLPYVDPVSAAQARYRQATAPAVEYGNELDAARRFREATTEAPTPFAQRVQDVVRKGADAIRGQAAPILQGAKAAMTSDAAFPVAAGALGAGSVAALTHILSPEEDAVASGGEADLAEESRPAPKVIAQPAPEAKPAITDTAEQDDNLQAAASPVSPGALRRQMRQMPLNRPTPATDMGESGELQLVDGNAHLAQTTGPAPVQQASLTPGQLTADYRKERSMYDLARRSGKSIEELRKLPEFANVGAMRGGDYTRADGTTGTMRSSAARDIAAQARIDDERARMDRWRAQMLLSSSNRRANEANAFNMLSPEAQQRVIESRFTHGGDAPAMDARVQAAMLETEARNRQNNDTLKAQADLAKQERDLRLEIAKLERDAAVERANSSNDLTRRGQDLAASTAAGNNTANLVQSLGHLGMQWLLGQGRNATDRYVADSRQPKPPPGQEELLSLQADEIKNKNAQSALEFAEQHIGSKYAWDRGLRNFIPWGSSVFTAQEQRAAYQALKAKFPQMPDGQARQIIDSIAARKTAEPASY